MVLEVKNRLLAGDVLEFLPPGTINCVRLRLYEFENVDSQNKKRNGSVTDRVTAGEGRAILIRAAQFHNESIAELKRLLPPLCVARKARPLTDQQAIQLTQNEKTQKAELGFVPARDLLRSDSERNAVLRSMKGKNPPKLGALGCCALGCNGCLPFWNEPKYEKARAVLQRSESGQLLSRSPAAG
jgi:putative protease